MILCDLVMPGLSGIDLVRRLVALCPETPVLVITAHATIETTVEAFRVGAADYLLKPLMPEELIPWLDEFEERWHQMIRDEPQLPFRVPRRYMG